MLRIVLLIVAAFALSLPCGSGAEGGEAPVADFPPQPAPATTEPALTPDILAQKWVNALRQNNLTGAYQLLTPVDQNRAELEWQSLAQQNDALVDLQLNAVLMFAKQANGAQQLAAMATPFIAQIDPHALSKQIEEIAGFLAMAANSQQPGTTPSLDYAGLHLWLKDLAAFIPQAGFTDQTKLSQALEHLVAALRNSTLTSAAEIRRLTLSQLLAKLTPAVGEIKQALAVYDVQVDALLDSFTFALSDVTPSSATLTIKFKTMNKMRSFPLKLVTKNGSWQLTDGADNPIAALSQLFMMSMLMQGMGPGTPAQPPPVIDDGAL